MLVLAWEKLTSALEIAMERGEQGNSALGNSLPGSVRGIKFMYDGSHPHLAHPDLRTDVLLTYHPDIW